MGHEPSFSRLVVFRALKNTWAIFGHRIFDGSLGLASFGIGGAIFWRMFGLGAVTEQLAIFAAFVLAPFAIFTVAAFVWHLIIAPAELIFERIAQNHAAALGAARQSPLEQPAKAPKPVNWSIWKHRKVLSVHEFSHVLANIDPVGSRDSPESVAFSELIVEDIKANRLQYIHKTIGSYHGSYDRPVDTMTETNRDDAIKWAQDKGFDVSHIL